MSEFEKWYRNPTRPVAVPPVPGPASFLEEHARAAWNAALAAAEEKMPDRSGDGELGRFADGYNEARRQDRQVLSALKSEGAEPR